jgi:hypothetical protein
MRFLVAESQCTPHLSRHAVRLATQGWTLSTFSTITPPTTSKPTLLSQIHTAFNMEKPQSAIATEGKRTFHRYSDPSLAIVQPTDGRLSRLLVTYAKPSPKSDCLSFSPVTVSVDSASTAGASFEQGAFVLVGGDVLCCVVPSSVL